MDRVENLSLSIINELKANANENIKQRAKYYFKEPNILNNIGVALDVTIKIIKKFKKDVKQLTSDEAQLLADILMRSDIDEAKHTALRILKDRCKECDRSALFSLIKSWLDDNLLHNWALVDLTSSYLLTYCLDDMPKLRSVIFKYSDSDILWHRRISVVAYVMLVKDGKYQDEFYKTAEKLVESKEDLMQKAVGWILRQAGVYDKDRLCNFIAKHGKKMGRTMLRYSIEHFSNEERRTILSITK